MTKINVNDIKLLKKFMIKIPKENTELINALKKSVIFHENSNL